MDSKKKPTNAKAKKTVKQRSAATSQSKAKKNNARWEYQAPLRPVDINKIEWADKY